MSTPLQIPAESRDGNEELDSARARTPANDVDDTIRRSVSFSDQLQGPTKMETESSADEQTAIVRRQRGTKQNYSGTTQSSRKSSLRAESSRGGDDQPAGSRQPADTRNSTTDAQGSRRSPLPAGVQPAAADEDGDEQSPKLNWWRSVFDKYGTIELQNKGSVARDHLALERTFLAWLRTSLSFASIGIAVTQLFRLDQTLADGANGHPQVRSLRHVGKPLGATFLGVGIFVLLVGFHRYFESQHYVVLGKFPASRGSIAIIAFCTGALVLASLVTILAVAPNALT